MIETLRLSAAAGILAGLAVSVAAAAAQQQAPALELPIRCDPGRSCWILNYVDADPGKGRKDYRCGWLTYDGHKGTDIALRDLEAMRRGVAVLAATPGVVVGVRDGVRDIDVHKIGGPKALKGKDCGNGVLVCDGPDWEYQYCHMRQGSVSVGKGQRVETGQRLGLVGMSGAAEMPHLHFQVKYKGSIVDPLVGRAGGEPCASGRAPLWKKDVLARLGYRSVHLYNTGFAGAKPEREAVCSGAYRGRVIPRDAPVLVLWAEVFWPRPGDRIRFRIIDPEDSLILDRRMVVEKFRGREIFAAGRKRRGGAWPAGRYRGEIRLIRDKGPKGKEGYVTRPTITVR